MDIVQFESKYTMSIFWYIGLTMWSGGSSIPKTFLVRNNRIAIIRSICDLCKKEHTEKSKYLSHIKQISKGKDGWVKIFCNY